MTERVLIDKNQLESLRELNEPGENDLVTELIDIFCKQSPITMTKLEEAIGKKDANEIEKMAHKLKGSCANIGAIEMRLHCQEMEDKGRNNNLESLEKLLDAIKSSYTEAIEVLNNQWRVQQ